MEIFHKGSDPSLIIVRIIQMVSNIMFVSVTDTLFPSKSKQKRLNSSKTFRQKKLSVIFDHDDHHFA